ncbi:MASE1 domain-containing protein [Dyella tabacisoli]|nr:MASE1 domain-containing protein [Dyella tabacisoli]
MQRAKGEHVWLRHVAVVIAYAVSYTLLRDISNVQWLLPAGLRLSCLLFVPYRYWPALALGECLSRTYSSYECLDDFGLTWVVLQSLPVIVLAMPIVWWFRRHMAVFPSQQLVSISSLLLCTLLVSLVCATYGFIALTTAHLAPGKPPFVVLPMHALGYFFGNYLGALTIVPLVVMATFELRAGSLRNMLSRVGDSHVMLDGMVLLLPTLALLTWLNTKATGDTSQIARMAMFLPVAWLTLKHGWRGAALGGGAACTCICLSFPTMATLEVLQPQAFMAFAATSLLMLGARITIQNKQEQRGQVDGQQALYLAQQGLYLGELRMRQTAYALEQISGAMQQMHGRLLNRLRHLLPPAEEHSYYRQVAVTQHQVHRLADGLYPRAWRDRGLLAGLRDGAMAQALDDARVTYQCEIQGRGLSQLSSSVHTALYRLACEAVVYLFAQGSFEQVRLYLRGGEIQGRRWAVLRLEGTGVSSIQNVDPEQLAPRLGASGLGLNAIRDHARIYGGDLHMLSTPKGIRVTMLLHDAAELERTATFAATPRLTVH